MADQADWTVWEKRYAALNQALSDLDNLLGTSTTATFPQKETLHYLVNRLLPFSVRQFYFFYDGFGRQTMRGLAKSEKTYPPEYAFGLTLDQVAYDFEVIQRAAFQRMAGNDRARSTLQKADQLARLALQPALDAGLFQAMPTAPAVVTYFQKSMSIRFIPYATVALIGIPLSCMYDPIDYLAIPHEMGHYVYRHGRVPGGRALNQAVPDAIEEACPGLKYIKNWQEELFADVYGSVIGGPVVALDFQDQQLENPDDVKSNKGFRKDDGEHPIPFLRPHIYSEVLDRTVDVTTPTLDSKTQLEGNWRGAMKRRGVSASSTININVITEEKVTLADAYSNLTTVVEKLLSSPPQLVPKPPLITWSWRLTPGSWKVAGLYDQFAQHIDDLIAQLTPNSLSDPAKWPSDTWEEWVK